MPLINNKIKINIENSIIENVTYETGLKILKEFGNRFPREKYRFLLSSSKENNNLYDVQLQYIPLINDFVENPDIFYMDLPNDT